MGVNALILLPPDVRLDDVADVAGILAGLPVERQELSGGAWSVRVRGAAAHATSQPEMADIILNGQLVDGEIQHYSTWHWEPDNNTKGERLLYPKSNAFWIAVGRRLVDFFGGRMTYSDCVGGINYRAKKPRKANNPSDGEPWQKFQEAKLRVKPITAKELAQANKWASYKTETKK